MTELKSMNVSAHLCPNIRVDLLSDSLYEEGEQQMTMVVLQFHPENPARSLSFYCLCMECMSEKKIKRDSG